MSSGSTIPCLQDAQLQHILTGTSSAEDKTWTAHLNECVECQRRLEELSGAANWTFDSSVSGAVLASKQWSSLYELIVRDLPSNPPFDDSVTALLAPGIEANDMGVFDGFRVLEVLGQGGMGVVLKAIEPLLDRVVAVKVLAPQLAASETSRKRFLSEARAVAQIEHPHVVGIYQVAQHNGLPYLVMPCVDGESLETLLRRRGTLDHHRTVAIAVQVCEALEAAHAAGIVHRDIKPGNLLIESATGHVMVTDFGLARAINDESLTRTGFIAGTPQYMSPEQAQGQTVDGRSDLYSLAAVMYAMLSGKPPFVAADALATIHQVVHDDPPSLSETTNNELPAWLVTLLERTLCKRPEDRPQSAAVLKQCLQQHSTSLLPTSRGREQRRLSHQAASAFGTARQVVSLLAFALVLFGVWIGSQWLARPDRDPSIANDAVPQFAYSLTSADGTTLEFDSLSGAVREAEPDSVILLRGAGVHAMPVPVPDVSLEIRGSVQGGDELPAIVIDGEWTIGGRVLLSNIELRKEASDAIDESPDTGLVVVDRGQLILNNCRMIHGGTCLTIQPNSECVVTDSLLASLGKSRTIDFAAHRETRLTIRNSILSGETAIDITPNRSSEGGELTLRDTTIYADNVICCYSDGPLGPRVVPLRIEARGTVFQARFLQVVDGLELSGISKRESRAQQQLRDRIRWRGDGNLFSLSEGFVGFYLPHRGFVTGRRGFRDLAGWRNFCAAEGESSVDAATSVLQVVRSPGELEATDIKPSTFALGRDRSTEPIGADLPGE